MTTLYYHKCDDCLTPFSSTERIVDFCDCNGTVTFMGVVQGTNFVKTENRPPCDGRCTHACGPVCDCQCGGANHGSGKLVATIVHQGKVRATGLTEEDIERAQMFRKFRDIAEVLYNNKHITAISNAKARVYSDYTAYTAMQRDRRKLDSILGLRVYERRQKDLIKFIVDNKSFAPTQVPKSE